MSMTTSVEGFHYAVSSRKGSSARKPMEDTHKTMTTTINILDQDSKQAEDVSFFGVFDGHGGRKAADFAAENIGPNIVDAMKNQIKLAGDMSEVDITDKDNQILSNKNLEEAVRAGYLKTDKEFLDEVVPRGVFPSGTTCVTALIINGKLVVSNAGDSRAVISRSRNGAEALTIDHRPGTESERQRIQKLGGIVMNRQGVLRLGALSVSRAIGDAGLAKDRQWLTAEPDTRIIQITSDDEFLILATDGLWDKVTNQEAVDIARPFCIQSLPGGPVAACEKLVELAVDRQSPDDITVMIVQLHHFNQLKED